MIKHPKPKHFSRSKPLQLRDQRGVLNEKNATPYPRNSPKNHFWNELMRQNQAIPCAFAAFLAIAVCVRHAENVPAMP
jgi:hypothetical protein